jgi:hypothetical protein
MVNFAFGACINCPVLRGESAPSHDCCPGSGPAMPDKTSGADDCQAQDGILKSAAPSERPDPPAAAELAWVPVQAAETHRVAGAPTDAPVHPSPPEPLFLLNANLRI